MRRPSGSAAIEPSTAPTARTAMTSGYCAGSRPTRDPGPTIQSTNTAK